MSTCSPAVKLHFEDALVQVEKQLASLTIVRNREINLKGLRGWIFEQTVRTCLEEELEKHGISPKIEEQARIGGRATVDFLQPPVALEVKVAGFFGDVSERYLAYRKKIESKGWQYFYLTLSENYKPYVEIARRTFGENRAFFLNQDGEWERFISEIICLLKKSPADSVRRADIRDGHGAFYKRPS